MVNRVLNLDLLDSQFKTSVHSTWSGTYIIYKESWWVKTTLLEESLIRKQTIKTKCMFRQALPFKNLNHTFSPAPQNGFCERWSILKLYKDERIKLSVGREDWPKKLRLNFIFRLISNIAYHQNYLMWSEISAWYPILFYLCPVTFTGHGIWTDYKGSLIHSGK